MKVYSGRPITNTQNTLNIISLDIKRQPLIDDSEHLEEQSYSVHVERRPISSPLSHARTQSADAIWVLPVTAQRPVVTVGGLECRQGATPEQRRPLGRLAVHPLRLEADGEVLDPFRRIEP